MTVTHVARQSGPAGLGDREGVDLTRRSPSGGLQCLEPYRESSRAFPGESVARPWDRRPTGQGTQLGVTVTTVRVGVPVRQENHCGERSSMMGGEV